jgi:hypothetical protein
MLSLTVTLLVEPRSSGDSFDIEAMTSRSAAISVGPRGSSVVEVTRGG